MIGATPPVSAAVPPPRPGLVDLVSSIGMKYHLSRDSLT